MSDPQDANPGGAPTDDPRGGASGNDDARAGVQVPTDVDVFAPDETLPRSDTWVVDDGSDDALNSHVVTRPCADSTPHALTPVEGRGHQGVAGVQTYTAPLPPKSNTPRPMPQSTTEIAPQPVANERRVRAKNRQEQRLERIREMDSRIRLDATRIVASYMLSASIDDSGEAVDGQVLPKWMRRRVALDGRQSKKTQPGYLADAMRICEWHTRKEAGQDKPPPVLNVGTVYVQNNVVYPVVDDEE